MSKCGHLSNYRIDKHNKKLLRVYEVLARLAIKYGCMGNAGSRYTNSQIEEMWNYDMASCPAVHTLKKYAKVSSIKWMIRNEIKVNPSIWTPDFLHGLSKNGLLKWNSRKFPSLKWWSNDVLLGLIKECPYGGDLYDNRKNPYIWKNVPAFYLPYSESGLDYLAGVLAGGRKSSRGGKIYAKYTTASKYIESIGVPIEHKFYSSGRTKHILVSPFWPALFSYRMPEKVGGSWLNIKNAAEASTYAAILWAVYVGQYLPKNVIPYMSSRRKIFYDFKCDEGAIEKLLRMRSERKMTQLDNRFKDSVMYWAEKNTEKNEEKDNEVSDD